MKKFNALLNCIFFLCGVLFLFSCKKNLEPLSGDEPAVSIAASAQPSVQAVSTDCRSTFLGVFVRRPDGVNHWENIMQKWYDANGKIVNIKANIGWDFDEYINFFFKLEWGAVTYEGNQVYLRDVLKNKLILRATIDDQGRTAATYFHSDPSGGGYPGDIDTTYYYYTGSRLDSFFLIHKFGPADNFPSAAMYRLMYDAYGNVVTIRQKNEVDGSYRLTFEYDYSKPTTGMVANYQIGIPRKMIEYMDLIRYPHHHQLTKVVGGPYTPGGLYEFDTYPVTRWAYDTHAQLAGGQVYSYVDRDSSPWVNTLFTGWECGVGTTAQEGDARQKNSPRSLEEFKLMYPVPMR